MAYKALTKEEVLADEKKLMMCIQAWNTRSWENHKKYLRRKQKEQEEKQKKEITKDN